MQIHIVQQGDSVYSIARHFRVPPEQIIHDNHVKDPNRVAIGQALVIEGAPYLHTVGAGDTIYKIAVAHNLSPEAILRMNPQIVNPDFLAVGQLIRILPRKRPQRTILANGYCYPHIQANVLDETLPFLTYLCSFSYNIREDGSVTPLDDSAVLRASMAAGVAPLLVLTNLNEEDRFSSELANAVLSNPELRQSVLENALFIMQSKGMFGLDVDFEYIYGSDRENLNHFMAEAVALLHPDYTVSSALAPKVRADQKGVLYEAADYAFQGQTNDWTTLMTYNWGYQMSPPMAVAPLNLVEDVIRHAVSVMPSEKILLGIPNYAFDWTLPYPDNLPAKLISNVDAVNLAAANNSEILFDLTAQSPYFFYTDDEDLKHVVWFDDARSYEAKYALIDKYDLAGIGYWNINSLFLPSWLVLDSMFAIEKLM